MYIGIGRIVILRASYLKYSIAFAFVAALLLLQPLCTHAFALFFSRDAPMAYYTSIGSFAPIPRSLTWSILSDGLIIRLGTLSAAATFTYEVVLWTCLGYMVLRILNPTFRLTTGVDWDAGLLTHTYMHTAPLIKAFLIAMAAVVPVFLMLAGIRFVLGDGPLALYLQLAVVGAAGWVLFSRTGIAGNYDNLNYELTRDRRRFLGLLTRGAISGLAAAWTFRQIAKIDAGSLFAFYSSLGSIGEAQWRMIAFILCGTAGWFAIGLAVLIIGLGTDEMVIRLRSKTGTAAVVILASAGVFAGWWFPRHLKERYDYVARLDHIDSTGRSAAARALASKLQLPPRSTETDTFIIVEPGRAAPLNVSRMSAVGLTADRETSRKIEDFLQRRGFATSLLDAAFMTMHDAASLRWDSAESLRVDYLRLIKCPSAQFMRVFIEKLQTSPATPECAHYADLLADESEFNFEMRDSLVSMGDIYARFGQKEKAAKWYRRAQIPPARIDEILPARTMFANGIITGRVFLNGRPAAGVQAGIVPAQSIQQISYNRIAPGVLRPFWLRWVGPYAVTDSSGRFAIRNIVAGSYRLIMSGPGLDLEPLSQRLKVEGGVGEVFVGFGTPKVDTGEIKFTVREPMTTL